MWHEEGKRSRFLQNESRIHWVVLVEEAPVKRVVGKGPRANGGVKGSVWDEVSRWCGIRRGEVKWSLPARRKSGGKSCYSYHNNCFAALCDENNAICSLKVMVWLEICSCEKFKQEKGGLSNLLVFSMEYCSVLHCESIAIENIVNIVMWGSCCS